MRSPVEYPTESFSADERARLAPHVSHLDRPVFALVNLPETVKGALFARYSRYPGTLRRLFLDEFADSLPEHTGASEAEEGERAAQLYERIFVGYGDDSVAQLGGAHIACEWVSNVLTKVLQRPRLGSYLEQSTRYIAYDAPMEGTSRYRYLRDPELGPEYEAAMDGLFDAYAEALPRVTAWIDGEYPGDPSPARSRAVKAKALDLLRGLLPAASLSHMGIYASGQTYEQLVLHLLAHPLPEAQRYGAWILDAVKGVMPSFVARVERPDRGGRWVEHLQTRDAAADRWVARLGLDRPSAAREEEAAGRPCACCTSTATRRCCSPRCSSRPRACPRRTRGSASPRCRPTSASRCCATSSASARTAGTAPAAGSRRCATASRSSPTTAPSVTCSATAC